MLKLIHNLWVEIPRLRKKQLKFLLMLMVASSVLEVISIGLVIPFLGVLIDPIRFSQQSILQPYLHEIARNDPKKLAYFFTILFCGTFVIAGAIRLFTQRLNLKISFSIGAELSSILFNRIMHQEYEIHISRNSGEIINTISVKMGYLMSAISHAMTIASSSIIMLLLCSILMIANPIYTAIIVCILLMSYLIINKITKNILISNSGLISSNSARTTKILQESIGSYRDILLDNSQKFHVQEFDSVNRVIWESEGAVRFIASAPRYLIETIGLIALSISALILTINGNTMTGILPLIGALVLALQRMLPAIQSIYSSWASIRGSQDMIWAVIGLMRQPVINRAHENEISEEISFDKEIEFINVYFKYHKKLPSTLEEINLKIKHGEKVGIIGSTGSGKSTFIDLFMGLLKPSFGEIRIDGKLLDQANLLSWQQKIGHVPQSIYLTDASIAENIAFNIPKHLIDFDRVVKSAKQAQLSTFIDSLSDSYETLVGERGAKLSGGQRQRIGIARALYKEADVIVFDEATSALDSETEDSIIDSINMLSDEITILIVSHRLRSLRMCNRIVEVKNKSVKVVKEN